MDRKTNCFVNRISLCAVEFRKTRQGNKAVVNPVLCKGDGLCCAKCPTLAIQLKHFTDEEILAQIDAVAESAYLRVGAAHAAKGNAVC